MQEIEISFPSLQLRGSQALSWVRHLRLPWRRPGRRLRCKFQAIILSLSNQTRIKCPKNFLWYSNEWFIYPTAADVLMDLKEVLDQHGLGSHGPHSLLEEAMTTTMVVIVAVSSTLLVASLLSAALLVIYCRRVKVLETTSILLWGDLLLPYMHQMVTRSSTL